MRLAASDMWADVSIESCKCCVTFSCSFHGEYHEMAPSMSVNFISLVTSCVGLREGEPQTALSYVIYMSISYSR